MGSPLDYLPPLLRQALIEDDDVFEAELLPGGRLALDTAVGIQRPSERYSARGSIDLDIFVDTLDPHSATLFLNAVADANDRVFNARSPELQAFLPDGPGIRVTAAMPPFSPELVINLRKLPTQVFPLEGSPNGYLEQGIVTADQLRAIRTAIHGRQSILVLGAMGSGKTTFLNAILREIAQLDPDRKVAVLEDTPELLVESWRHVRLRPHEGQPTLADILPSTYRYSAQSVVVNEVRGPEAAHVLSLWGSGHKGALTFHADDPSTALRRFDALCRAHFRGSQHVRIADAIDLVLVIRRTAPRAWSVVEAAWLTDSPSPDHYRFAPVLPRVDAASPSTVCLT